MSGTAGANLPVTIRVQGGAEAEQAFNRVATTGTQAMQRVGTATDTASTSGSRFSSVIGQAGFQLQDFAGQVGAGTSALTALSQQGSQFLGIFGTGGAVAGAVLTVGILAAQLMGVGTSGKSAADGVDELTRAMEDAARRAAALNEVLIRTQDRFVSIAEAGRNRALRETAQDIGTLQVELEGATFNAINQRRIADAARQDLETANQAVRGQGPLAGDITAFDPGSADVAAADAQRRIPALQARLDAAEAEARNAEGRARRMEFDIRRLEGLQGGLLADSSNSNPGTFTPEREARTGGGGRLPRTPAERADPALAEAERLRQSVETPQERFDRRIAEIGSLATRAADAGAPLDDETLLRAGEKAQADLEAATRQTTSALRQQDDVTRQLGLTFTSAFEDAVIKGKSLSDVLKGIEQDLLRLGTRKLITEPLAGLASSALGSITGGAGLAGLGGAATGFLASLFGGGGGTVTPSLDQMATPGFFASFHTGGLVGDAPPSRVAVNASVFEGAPRYHAGGIAGLKPDEVPAILQRGERVLSRDQARRGMGNVINMTVMAADAPSFRASQAQIMGDLARALARGQRNL
jgi:hypothetical protein